jgi:putative acetyltransferase
MLTRSKGCQMHIREEKPSDIDNIREINSEAFETIAEANLVDALRTSGCTRISLVAETENGLVGHILFTPVDLSGCENNLKMMGLAPMAVKSQFQNKGIGSKLVQEGLKRCQFSGYDAVVVLGHSDYYPRFGFEPAVRFCIKSEYEVPDDVFLIIELKPNTLTGYKGVIKYQDEFNVV